MSIDIFKEIENKGNAAEALKLGVIDIRQVAQSYEYLQRVINAAKEAQGSLEPTLLENKVSELFPDNKDKVVFVEGKELAKMSPETVQRFCTPTVFGKMVSITAKAITDTYKSMDGEGFSEKAEVIIAKSKKVTGSGKNTVKCSKMTATEIKESK